MHRARGGSILKIFNTTKTCNESLSCFSGTRLRVMPQFVLEVLSSIGPGFTFLPESESRTRTYSGSGPHWPILRYVFPQVHLITRVNVTQVASSIPPLPWQAHLAAVSHSVVLSLITLKVGLGEFAYDVVLSHFEAGFWPGYRVEFE